MFRASIKRIIKVCIGSLSENSSVIGAISGLLSIITFITSMVMFVLDLSTKKPVVICLFVAIIMLLITLAFFVLSYYSAKAQSTFIAKKYYELLHDYRNDINELKLQFDNTAISNIKQKDLTYKVKRLIQKMLDHLVDTIKIISKKQSIAACVKLIDYSERNQSVRNSRVSTFIRDSQCPAERRALDESAHIKSVLIADNTDFNQFFTVRDPSLFETSIFYEADLLKYDRENRSNGGYHNTTPNWQDYYIGTAVVPIRIKTKRIYAKCKSEEYTLIGFLCVDSIDSDVFTPDKREIYSYILKSYAALICQVLLFYTESLKKVQPPKMPRKPRN